MKGKRKTNQKCIKFTLQVGCQSGPGSPVRQKKGGLGWNFQPVNLL